MRAHAPLLLAALAPGSYFDGLGQVRRLDLEKLHVVGVGHETVAVGFGCGISHPPVAIPQRRIPWRRRMTVEPKSASACGVKGETPGS